MKVNTIVDTSYIFYKAVHALNKVRELNKLKISLTYTLKNLMNSDHYDNFILAFDSRGSWRKRIYPEYKAPRKEKRDKDDVNWDSLFKLYDEWKIDIVKNTSAIILESDHMEGDDVISQFVQKSNLRGDSNVIIASDRDLLQLVKYSQDPDYINLMINEEYKHSKIYLPIGGEAFLDKLRSKNNKNVFFMSSDNSQFIRFVDEQMAKREILEVLDEEKLFLKIIAGDGKDNIDSTHYKYNLEKGTRRGIGEGTAKKIYKRYKELNPEPINFKSKDFIIRSKNIIAENRKIQEEEELETVQKSIILNTKLIMLDSVFIPKGLVNDLNEKIDVILYGS